MVKAKLYRQNHTLTKREIQKIYIYLYIYKKRKRVTKSINKSTNDNKL